MGCHKRHRGFTKLRRWVAYGGEERKPLKKSQEVTVECHIITVYILFLRSLFKIIT